MKVLALDYGSARTGIAVSDPTGTLARPVKVVRKAGSAKGLLYLVEVIRAEEPGLIGVGLPLTPKGARGAQAIETEQFVAALREAMPEIPVETWDERFTTALAARSGAAGGKGTALAGEDARAAAHLLESYLHHLAGRP